MAEIFGPLLAVLSLFAIAAAGGFLALLTTIRARPAIICIWWCVLASIGYIIYSSRFHNNLKNMMLIAFVIGAGLALIARVLTMKTRKKPGS